MKAPSLRFESTLDIGNISRRSLARAVLGFLISVGACSIAFVPVMVFTFIGLAGSPYIRETNSLFAEFIQVHGLLVGLLLAFLSNIVPAAIILGFVHLLFYRPFVFYDPQHVALARKLVAAGVALFLLVWGQKFFLDGYNDMTILNIARIGSSEFLWGVLLACLSLFITGLVWWGKSLAPAFQGQGGQSSEGGRRSTADGLAEEASQSR